MKERTRKYVKLSLILYVALLSAAVIATVAWFVSGQTASIKTSDDMVIRAGEQLEISIDGENWMSSIGLPTGNQVIPDITGDGANFYYPTALDSNDEPIMSDASTFLDVSDNPNGEYYIELKVKLRTAAQTKVYLSNESYIRPKDLTGKNDLSETVSKDILAGAVRVCFFEEGKEESDRAIWIPNAHYELVSNGSGFSFRENGKREEKYRYLLPDTATNKMTEHVWGIDDFKTGKVMVGDAALASPAQTDEDGNKISAMTNGGSAILSFDGGSEMTEKTLVIRIWLEGTDREAHTTLVGGAFDYNLSFISVNEKNNNNPLASVKWENNQLTGIPDDVSVLYSFDAIDWHTYSNMISDAGARTTMYVRAKETASKKCGDICEITKTDASNES